MVGALLPVGRFKPSRHGLADRDTLGRRWLCATTHRFLHQPPMFGVAGRRAVLSEVVVPALHLDPGLAACAVRFARIRGEEKRLGGHGAVLSGGIYPRWGISAPPTCGRVRP